MTSSHVLCATRRLTATFHVTLAFVLWPVAAPAQGRLVTGTVLDAETGVAVSGAQVSRKGAIGAVAGARDDGTFAISLPAGRATLVVRRIGYTMREVPLDETATDVRVLMRRDILRLDEVVVTGHASTTARRNATHATAVVSAEELTKVPAASIEFALQGKIAGAQIYKNTGAPGGGSRVLIRGSSSVNGTVAPLYVIDGVIVSNRATAPGLNRVTLAAGGIADPSQEDPVNRIADIAPEDIESIEILKGSSAAAIYGSKASSGVVLITTRRGGAGRARVNVRSGLGTSRLSYRNGSRKFPSLAAARAAYDSSNAWGDALWATYYDPDRHFDLEELLYGEKPLNSEAMMSISGGSADTRYFVSGVARNEGGIVKRTFADKMSARINLDQSLGTRGTLALGTELARNTSDRGLFGNENSPGGGSVSYTLARTPSFYDLRQRPDGGFPGNPFYTSNPFHTIATFRNDERVWRAINTARLTVQPVTGQVHEVRLVAQGGADLFHQRNYVFSPPELEFEEDGGLPGTAVVSESRNLQRTLNVSAVHVFSPNATVSVSSQLGSQYDAGTFDITRALGKGLIGGVALPSGGTFRDVSTLREEYHDFGVFAQTEALFRDRLFLTIGARADRGSNNGDPGRFLVFPKAAASFRVLEMPRWAGDELKLRLAYGETGNKPAFGARFTPLGIGTIGGLSGIGLFPRRGAPDIRPERQRELEGGIDIVALGGRAELGLTGFQRNVADLLLNRSVAPSQGYSSEMTNGGNLRIRGFEAVANAFRAAGTVSWNTRIHFGLNRTRVTRLYEPLAPFGSRLIDGQILVEVGASLTQMIGSDTVTVAGSCPPRAWRPTACESLNVGDVHAVYVGDASPRYTAGFGNEVRWRNLSLYSTLDRQKGGLLRSTTWASYDGNRNSRDYDEPSPDPSKTLGRYRADQAGRVTMLYLQDASYWKLREVTVGYDIPSRVARRYFRGAESARLSASGRNLKTWTRFRGGDPEYTNFGSAVPDALQRNRELAPYPPSRQFWLTLQAAF